MLASGFKSGLQIDGFGQTTGLGTTLQNTKIDVSLTCKEACDQEFVLCLVQDWFMWPLVVTAVEQKLFMALPVAAV